MLDALSSADVTPAEVRFTVEDAAGGATGGSIGGGTGTSVEVVAEQLEDVRNRLGAEPVVIAVRTVGVVDSLGELDDAVHSRVLVPEGVSAALSAPEHGGVQVVRDTGACS